MSLLFISFHKENPNCFCYVISLVLFSPTKLPSLFFAFICPIREFRVKVDDAFGVMNEGYIVVICEGICESEVDWNWEWWCLLAYKKERRARNRKKREEKISRKKRKNKCLCYYVVCYLIWYVVEFWEGVELKVVYVGVVGDDEKKWRWSRE